MTIKDIYHMTNEKGIGNSPLIGVPKDKLVFRIKDGSITIRKLATEVLNLIMNGGGGGGGGVGVSLIDISERMTEDNDTITDMEIKTSLFIYRTYNKVSAIARVVEPSSGRMYALFKVCLYDSASGKNRTVYFAYTTEDVVAEGATWHYSGMIDENDSLCAWAMSVFGDVVVDFSDDTIVIGSNVYHLEQSASSTIRLGQTSGSARDFAYLNASQLAEASTEVDTSEGTPASGTVAGVSVDGCWLHSYDITAGNSIFFVMLPSGLSVVAATMSTGSQNTGRWNGEEIRDSSIWEAVHDNVSIGDKEFAVYGYRNIALGGSTMNIYIR